MAPSLAAQTAISVATAGDLVNAITTIDANPTLSYVVNFSGPVSLTSSSTLPAINTTGTITIDGHGNTLDGGGIQRGFFIYAGTVTLQNLAINHAVAKGGNGGNGGGGGMGAGGALFMSAGTHVTLTNMSFSQNSAVGGAGGGGGPGDALGGPIGAGGGGGMGGNGGSSATTAGGGYGGGGGFGWGADGGAGGANSGAGGNGGPGILLGAVSAAGGTTVVGVGGSGGPNGGGGGGGGAQISSSLSYGGSGGNGGAAGYGGGGGGGSGAAGGYGGGGGCAGGWGGYGGGAGTYIRGAAGTSAQGGFGGGNGIYYGGGSGAAGGGMGAGGAIFNAGGTLTVTGTLSLSGGTVTAGSPNGRSFSEGIFMGRSDHGPSTAQPTITFTPAAGQTQRVSDTIGDESVGLASGLTGTTGITMNGAGTLVLAGTNFYSSDIAVQSGTLDVEASNAGGYGTTTVASGAMLTGQGSVSKLVLLSGSFFQPGPALTTFSCQGDLIWNGGAKVTAVLSNTDSTSTQLAINGAFTKSGSGQFTIDIQRSGQGGRTYTLATFKSTTFAASDFSAVNLPTGLTGTFVVTPTQLQFQLLNPSVPVPVLQSGIAEGAAGTPLSYQIVGTNSPYIYSVVSGTLPPGLTLNPSTGLISGTPTTMGDYTVVVSAGNAGGSAATSVRFEIAIATVDLKVATAADLVAAITRVNSDPATEYTITFTAPISLGPATPLPILAPPVDLKIYGAGFVLDGGGTQRGFYVTKGNVDFVSLTIQNMVAHGGNGANGGGGGLGAGGALYLQSPANVSLDNVTFGSAANPNRAIGGAGSSIGPVTAPTGFGGGGGMATNGAPGSYLVNGGTGGNGVDGTGGGAGGAGATGAGAAGGPGGGGGGAGILPNSSIGGSGGAGGFGGGGGAGGFSGAGAGGFGGGGGGANGAGAPGTGGYGAGAGDASSAAGGGGLGAGGAIFVNGGTLGFGSGGSVSGNTVTGGSGGISSNAGSALGAGMFLVSPNDVNLHPTITFSAVGGSTETISDTITDSSNGASGGWHLDVISGPGTSGTVALSGANTFSGGLSVHGGILAANNTSGSASGSGPVDVQSGGTLTGTGSISGAVTLGNGSFVAPGTGIGSLTVGPVTWTAGAEILSTLSSTDATSSRLVVNGALTKSGTGNFVFNFQSTGITGQTYTLASYASTTFTAADFSYIGLTQGLTGTFTVGPTSLQFTTSGEAAKIPVITSSTTASGTLGIAFSYAITATNSPTSFPGNTAVIPGLTLNTTTGVISGTPTQKGTFVFGITAANSVGSGSATLTLTIAAAPAAAPVITSSGTASGTQGVAFTYGITASNTPTSYAVSGSLPAGLSLNTASGVISGTPTQSGTFPVTISASNASGSGSASLAITIAAPASTGTSPSGGGGGGGGAPSLPFLAALATLFVLGLNRRWRADASGTT